MIEFSEPCRYNYRDLTSDSIVFDGGSFHGNWAMEIWKRYHPNIFCFEPVAKFAQQCREYLPPEITVSHSGLGAYARKERFGVQNDSSGIFAKGITEETVEIVSLPAIVIGCKELSLLKLNVEGFEMEILEALIAEKLMTKIKHLQIQPHSVFPGAENMWEEIQARLLETHELVYYAPWCWSGYTRRL